MALRKVAKTPEKVADNNLFATVANQWFEHWKDGKSSRHLNSTRRRLDSNILPSLGALQTAKIKAPDVVAMVRVIEARGRTILRSARWGLPDRSFVTLSRMAMQSATVMLAAKPPTGDSTAGSRIVAPEGAET